MGEETKRAEHDAVSRCQPAPASNWLNAVNRALNPRRPQIVLSETIVASKTKICEGSGYMYTDDLVVLDFETTGLSPALGHRITEVAAIRLRAGKIIDSYESLVNCGVRVPPFITQYTGITQTMVDGAPGVKKVIGELLKFISTTAVVAHNSSFDQRFLDNECRLATLPTNYSPLICSLRVARRIYPHFQSHALEVLAQRLKISYLGIAHRAKSDAEVTVSLLLRMAQDLRAKHRKLPLNSTLLRAIMEMPIATAAEAIRHKAM